MQTPVLFGEHSTIQLAQKQQQLALNTSTTKKLTTLDHKRYNRSSKSDTLVENGSEANKTEFSLPKNIEQFNSLVTYQIAKMHDQFKIRFETEHENKLLSYP